MTRDSQQTPIFRIDVTADASKSEDAADTRSEAVVVSLLRRILDAQERQCELVEELTQQLGAAQRQRAAELGQWREANPDLSRGCRLAAESLSRVQTQFLEHLTEEVIENEECLADGEFMMNEFVDRYGPRLAHLNGVLQVLSQLSSVSTPTNAR